MSFYFILEMVTVAKDLLKQGSTQLYLFLVTNSSSTFYFSHYLVRTMLHSLVCLDATKHLSLQKGRGCVFCCFSLVCILQLYSLKNG